MPKKTPLRRNSTASPTADQFAAEHKDHGMLRSYLGHAAGVDSAEADSTTLLHLAGKRLGKLYVNAGLDDESDVNARDKDSNSPLHLAATVENHMRQKNLLAADKLRPALLCKKDRTLNHKAYVNAENKDGAAQLHLAVEHGDDESLHVLLRHGVNVNTADKDGTPPLHLAAKRGNDTTLKILLDHKANVNAEDKKGTTPLHLAADRENSSTLNILLDHKANVNAKDKEGTTPLHLAAKRGNDSTLKILLDHLANVNAEDNNGATPLHLAATYGNYESQYVLLRHGARVNAEDKDGNTPLHLASERGNDRNLEILLFRRANVNAEDKKGTTPLHLAADRENSSTLNILLDHKANVSAEDKEGTTPLHLAAKRGNDSTLTILLDHKANVNAKDKEGTTPLHLAADRENSSTLTILLDHKANVNAEDKEGTTPLHLAAKRGNDSTLTILLDHKANVNAKDKNGATPLHLTATYGNYESLYVLLRHGAIVNAEDKDGNTPLHLAANRGNDRNLEILLFRRANVNAKDKKGTTPLHLAAVGGKLEATKCLLEHGASVNARDKIGNSPLSKAACAGHAGIVQFLTSCGKNKDVLLSKAVRSASISAQVAPVEEMTVKETPVAEYSNYSYLSSISYSDISDSESSSESNYVLWQECFTSKREPGAEYSDGSCCSSTSSASDSLSERSSDVDHGEIGRLTIISEKLLNTNDEDTSSLATYQSAQQGYLQSEKKTSKPELLTVRDWQASSSFTAVGGTLRKSFSDVILTVPPSAVKNSTPVPINTAVCTDLDLIRRVLKLPSAEEIVSPMAEYSTDPPGFHFTKHVCIQMPHFLQPDFDPSLLHVYHVTKGSDGQVNKTSLKLYHGKDKNENPAGAPDLTVYGLTTYAQVTEDGKINIYTDRFCGFVCTYCGKKKKTLQLFAAVQGCFDWAPQRYPLIRVNLFIWDARITIADFSKMYGVEPGEEKTMLNLLDELTGTRLHARLRLCAEDGVRFPLDDQGQPLIPIETYFDLPQRLCCKKCTKKGKTSPMTYSWELRPQSDAAIPSYVSVSVDTSHVTANRSPAWVSSNAQETVTCTMSTVRRTTLGPDSPDGQERAEWQNQLPTMSTERLKEISDLTQKELLERNHRHVQRTSREPVNCTPHQAPSTQQKKRPAGLNGLFKQAVSSWSKSKADVEDGLCLQVNDEVHAGPRPQEHDRRQRRRQRALSPLSDASCSTSPPLETEDGESYTGSNHPSMSEVGQGHEPQDDMNSYLREHQSLLENRNMNTPLSAENRNMNTPLSAENDQAASISTGARMSRLKIESNTGDIAEANRNGTFGLRPNQQQSHSDTVANGNDVTHRMNGEKGQHLSGVKAQGRRQENGKPQRVDSTNPDLPNRGMNGFRSHTRTSNGDLHNGHDNTVAKEIDESSDSDDDDDNTYVKRPVDIEKTTHANYDGQMVWNGSFLDVLNVSCPSSFGSWEAQYLSVDNPSESF